jgi:AcrR family transcriptional regulator
VTGAVPARSARGERTRALIFEAAMALFHEGGYEGATMRAIADRAGVSLGSSYHYFPSKEHLVLAFYEEVGRRHREACAPVLAGERTLAARMRGTLHTLIATCEPFHDVAGSIAGKVADPTSAVNPLGPASAHLRGEGIALYREVLDGAAVRVPDDVAEVLPELLWLHQMGVIYFWVMDTSPDRRATAELIDETCELVAGLVALLRLPVLRGSRDRALRLVRSIASQLGPQSE